MYLCVYSVWPQGMPSSAPTVRIRARKGLTFWCRVAGCVFNNLRGDAAAGNSVLVEYAPVTFNSTVLRALSKPRGDPGDWRRLGWQRMTGALYAEGLNTTVVLANSSIANPLQPWPIVLRDGAALFSNNSTDMAREPPPPLPPPPHTSAPPPPWEALPAKNKIPANASCISNVSVHLVYTALHDVCRSSTREAGGSAVVMVQILLDIVLLARLCSVLVECDRYRVNCWLCNFMFSVLLIR